MIKFTPLIGLMFSVLLLQACNSGTNGPRPAAPSPQTAASQKPSQATTSRDDKYIELLEDLSRRNPTIEAQQAIARGERQVMAYYAGRAGLKIPGLTQKQQTAQRCSLKTLDGLGDVIYGENHLKYRVALRRFAETYNIAMVPACL